MDRQLLWHLIQAAALLAPGAALIALSLGLIQRHQHDKAVRQRMAEVNATGPGLAAITGGKAQRQGAWWRKGGGEGRQSRAA